MAERLKAPVLKTGMVRAIEGSNPSLSAGEVAEWPKAAVC